MRRIAVMTPEQKHAIYPAHPSEGGGDRNPLINRGGGGQVALVTGRHLVIGQSAPE
jgi:hypothetical protein